jgi:putative ABC transport system permease protein
MEVIEDAQDQQVKKYNSGPEPGNLWVEPRLLQLLNIQLGDSIEVGYSQLQVSKVIVNEPDRGIGFGFGGARIMMNWDDLPNTQLVRPGSRITYKLLVSGEDAALDDLSNWFSDYKESDSELATHFRLRNPESAEEQLGEALQRGRGFLLLSGSIGVLLAGLAMALAAQRYAARLTDQVALMKAWGQSSSAVRQSQFIRLVIISSIATLLGIAIGWAAHYGLLWLAKGMFEVELPLPSWRPWIVAFVTGYVCVIGFTLPALWHLPAIAPLRVLRRDLPDNTIGQSKRFIIGIIALLVLTYWYSGSLLTASLFLLALFALIAICALFSLQILRLVQSFANWRGSFIRLGLANLWRRRGQTLIQLIGFSITLMLLLVVTGMRTSLIEEWQAQLPEDAPTHFLFNVSAAQVEPIKTSLESKGISTTDWYPMVRGRLVAINGEKITAEQLEKSDGLSREVNFTQSDLLPFENEIIQGEWFNPNQTASTGIDGNANQQQIHFSMEEDVATEIGVTIGDQITFSIGGVKLDAELTSIRTVNWQSMTPNFYVIFNQGALDKFTPNWITSIRAGDTVDPSKQTSKLDDKFPFVAEMIKSFPTAVIVEIGSIIEQIKLIISRVTLGLEMILLLVLACGTLVLFAAIGVSYDERLRENAILRTLGSTKKVILGSLAVEFATLGAIAGFIASIGAETILYFVQLYVFNLEPKLHPQLWAMGIVSGVLLISSLGLLRSRKIVSTPPLYSLKQLG